MKAWIGGLMILCFANVFAYAAPGEVQVVFRIDSEKFQRGLQGTRGAVESELSRKLANSLQSMFPLIEWVGSAPAGAPAATLVASLAQDGQVIPNIEVRWTAKIGDQDLAMPHLHAVPIYQVTNIDRPYRNPTQLTDDVNAKVTAWIQTDTVDKVVHDEFVTQVPLATSVKLDSSIKAILIPLEWRRSKLGEQTEFRLEFTRTAPLSRIKIKLNGVAERLSEPMPGDTQCLVASCTASSVPVNGDAWQNCVEMLNTRDAPPLLVSVDQYQFNDHPDGIETNGTAVRP